MDQPPARLTITPAPTAISYLLLAAIMLGTLAYWLPWIDQRTAALKLSGQDLGEFVQFVPALQGGALGALHQVLYLPPLVALSCLVLLSANRYLPYTRLLRVGMLVLALLLLSGVLPPVWGHPRDLFTPQYRIQGVAAVAGVAFAMAHGWLRQIRLVSLARMIAALGTIAVLPVQCVFWAAWPAIRAVYGSPTIHLGWGLGLHIALWSAAVAVAIALMRWSHVHESQVR